MAVNPPFVVNPGPLDWRISITDKNGRPSPEFQRRWEMNRNNTDLIAGPGDPTAIASDQPVVGSADTYMRSDSAPAVQKATDDQFGIVKVDGTTIEAVGGVISVVGGASGNSYVPLSMGTEPLTFVSNGTGQPILVPFTA